jgi:hypothetical protein
LLSIVFDNAEQQSLDFITQVVIDAANLPAIHDTDDVSGQQNQITGMRIRMIKAVTEDHFQIHVGAAPRKLS